MTVMEENNYTAKEFITIVDKQNGQGWSNDSSELCNVLDMYADSKTKALQKENQELRSLLGNISAWLAFNTQPSAEELSKMKKSIESLLSSKIS
jgi:hypothetical protein